MSHVLYGRALPHDLLEKLKEKSSFKRGKSTPTPEKDKADKLEGQNKEGSSVGKKSTSWWPFGGKKPDTDEENNVLSSTPSKIDTAEDASETLMNEVIVNVPDDTSTPNVRKRRNETTSSSEGDSDADKSK